LFARTRGKNTKEQKKNTAMGLKKKKAAGKGGRGGQVPGMPLLRDEAGGGFLRERSNLKGTS